MNKIRVIELFAGYGSQHLALKRLKRDFPEFDYEVVAFCEIDKHAITAYRALHGEQIPNLGDITKVNPTDVPDCDLMTWSFPCGLQGTLVKTLLGYCDIKDIKQGDIVLTHKNRYRKVLNVMKREVPSYYEIRAVGCRLHLTGEHPLLVLRKNKQQWVRVCDLQKTDLISYNIPVTIDKFKNIDDSLLWLLGRYVSDGWIDKSKYNSIEFSIGNTKTETFDNHINNLPYKFHKVFKKGCIEYRVADKELQNICFEFGIGAKSKKIPQWLIDMPSDKITSFLDGYFSGDGHVRYRSGTKVQMFTTVSKELFLGLQNLLIKSYGKVCSLTIRHDARKVSFSDTYNGQIALSSKTLQRVTGDKIFVPIKHINYIKDKVKVYNISVDDDESYTCDNVISHNCTDISSAGQQKGLAEGSNTRSSLCWDAIHIFEEKRPKYLLMENVSGLVSKRFINDFDNLQSTLRGIGYTNFFKIINSKDMGVPQNRKRLFMVSILGDGVNYSFPAPMPLGKDVTQLLEDSVDERYYLSAERVCDLISKVRDTEGHLLRNVLGWTRDRKGVVVDYHTVDVANCVTANKRDNTCNYVMERHFLNGDKDGNASTLTTSHDFAGNITTPKGGHKQMGVLEIKKFDTNELVRVRKLTEREYFRIMDVDEKDIDALLTSGVPNTQLAKLAGNSIVVNVLYHIFRTMFIDTGKKEGTQTSLF